MDVYEEGVVHDGATYTHKALAQTLGRSEKWIMDNVIGDGCPSLKTGAHYLISGHSFRNWIEGRTSKSESPSTGCAVAATLLPIVHIDCLAGQLRITRDWINRRWLLSDDPPPHFRDGDAVFFPIDAFARWAERRVIQD